MRKTDRWHCSISVIKSINVKNGITCFWSRRHKRLGRFKFCDLSKFTVNQGSVQPRLRIVLRVLPKIMKTKYRIGETVLLIVGIIATLLISGEASSSSDLISGWNLWLILPYLSFFLISLIANNKAKSEGVHIASFITSILILLFPLFIYIDAFYIHTSSTSSLVLLFVPLYIFIGGPVLFLMTIKIIGMYQIKKRVNALNKANEADVK
ncbi:MAG: hypothetical protein GY797_09725 [Deltaproteobacteria bacterium]|nr:hypothetical protein [Deltaproteobacteria bacterium]